MHLFYQEVTPKGLFRIFTSSSYSGTAKIGQWASLANGSNDYFILFDHNAGPLTESVSYLANSFESVDRERFFFCSSTRQAHENRLRAGLNSYLISNNIMVNENIFFFRDSDVIYDAMLVARDMDIKRIALAKNVANIAYVIDRWYKSSYHKPAGDWAGSPYSYLNDGPLGPAEISELFARSACSLIFTEREGACFSVTESLLCGCPVISSRPQNFPNDTLGGRELWLNSDNSVWLKDDTPESVEFAVALMSARALDRQFIAKQALDYLHSQRHYLAELVLAPIIKSVDSIADPYYLASSQYIFDNSESQRLFLASDGVYPPITEISRQLFRPTNGKQVILARADKAQLPTPSTSFISSYCHYRSAALFPEEINSRPDRQFLIRHYYPALKGERMLQIGCAGYTRNYPNISGILTETVDIDARAVPFGSRYKHDIADFSDLDGLYDHISFYGILGHSSCSIELNHENIENVHSVLDKMLRPGGSLLLGHQKTTFDWNLLLASYPFLQDYQPIFDELPDLPSNLNWWRSKPANVSVLLAHPDDCYIFLNPLLRRLPFASVKIFYLTKPKAPLRLDDVNKYWSTRGVETICLGLEDSSATTLESIPVDSILSLIAANADMIVSHGRDGEYGHEHHQICHKIASLSSLPKIFFSHSDHRLANLVVELGAHETVDSNELLATHAEMYSYWTSRLNCSHTGWYIADNDAFLMIGRQLSYDIPMVPSMSFSAPG